jgi:hypothetical protein
MGDDSEQSGERSVTARRGRERHDQLEAAIATYNDALAVFVAASAIHYIEVCWENRDRAIALLAERRPRTEPTKPADAAVLLPSL